ncbi:MAG: dihydroorotate dehydrogenase [Armatimonadota bacterium]
MVMASNLSVKIAGVTLANPVITASGTFGFGREYGALFPLSELGAVTVKGLTLQERMGNAPPRVAETPSGMLNSVGLQNPGVERFIREELPWLKTQGTVIIANIAGSTIEDYCAMAERLSDTEVDLLELNISCPNVKQGGVAFGTTCENASGITAAVRAYCKKPLIVKLSPNVSDIAEIAVAVVDAGADALSLINTLLGMRIDINTRRPILANNVGGLSGPAVHPIAVRMVWQVRNRVTVPIIGMGGVATWEDAVEMLLAGANAIAVGTAMYADPYAPVKIKQGLQEYLERNGIADVNELVSAVQVNQ